MYSGLAAPGIYGYIMLMPKVCVMLISIVAIIFKGDLAVCITISIIVKMVVTIPLLSILLEFIKAQVSCITNYAVHVVEVAIFRSYKKISSESPGKWFTYKRLIRTVSQYNNTQISRQIHILAQPMDLHTENTQQLKRHYTV